MQVSGGAGWTPRGEAVLDGAGMGIFTRRTVGIVLTPALFIVAWFAPLGLEPPAQHLAAVFAAVIVAWVTEVVPIAVTALLIAPGGLCELLRLGVRADARSSRPRRGGVDLGMRHCLAL